MALGKQNVTVPVNSQLDTKTDSFLTEAANALIQENVRFYQTGALVKRPGFAQLESSTTDPDPLSLGAKRIVSDNKQLFALGVAGPDAVQTWQDGWRDLAPPEPNSNVIPGQVKLIDYFGGDKQSRSSWMDFHEGKYAITIDERLPGGSFLAAYPVTYVYDGSSVVTLNTLLDGSSFSANDEYIKLRNAIIDLGVAGNFLVTAGIYISGGVTSLRVRGYDINLTTSALIYNDTLAGFRGEVAITPSQNRGEFYVAVRNGANTIKIYRFGQTSPGVLGLVSSASITTVASIESVLDMANAGQGLSILCQSTAGNLPVLVEASSGTLAYIDEQSPSLIDLGLASSTLTLAGSVWRDNAGDAIVGWSTINTGSTIQTSITRIVPATNTVTLRAAPYGVKLNGKGYTDANKSLVPVVSMLAIGSPVGIQTHSSSIMMVRQGALSDFNNVTFLCNSFFERVIFQTPGTITNFVETSSGKFSYIVAEATEVSVDDTTLSPSLTSRAALTQFDFNNTDSQYGSELSLGDSLVLMNANPSTIDGSRVSRISFSVDPVITANASTTGGSLLAGTYQVSVHFEGSDERGNIVRSAESNQVSLTTTGTTSSITVRVLTSLQVSNSSVCVYMTQLNGNTKQLVFKKGFDQFASATSYVITLPPDTSAPLIYTTGGVLESNVPGPSLQACLFNNRIFSVPADEFNKVYYSNKYIQGEIPSFNNNLFIETANSTPRYRDRITAVQGVSDKLVIFRENSIYWVAGDGANLLGVNSSFTEPEVLAQDIGCKDSRSVVLTPVGIMFKSDKGIYLVDGGLSLSYVGAPVETYNAESIIDTCLITQRNIVLMLTASRILCFDYLQQRWSVDTVSGLASLAIWQNKIVALKASGRLSVESTAFVDDFGEMTPPSISMKLVTGWMKLSGLQDYARIWRLLILGRWKSSHTLTVKVYYDYDDTTVETYTISQTTSLNLYQFNIHLRRQKCESIKVELFDTGSGQSLDITGMTLEVGVKQGTMKVPAARKL